MNLDKPKTDNSYDAVCRFIIKLGKAAHAYGSNSARLEAFLLRVTKYFGYLGVFRSAPTEIVFAFQENANQWQRTQLVKTPGSGLELARLAKVGKLVDDIEAGEVSVPEASARLDEIANSPHPWGVVANAASYLLCGAAFSVLMSGGWWDVLFAGIFSLAVYGIVLLSGRFGIVAAEWIPLSSAFVAGALVAAAKLVLPEINVVLVTLSAILILIAGYPISTGIVELVGKHVTSGTANLMSGLVYLAKQIAGAWLGVGLVGALVSLPHAPAGAPVSPQWLWIFMPLLIAGLCVVFQTSREDFLWASLGCGVAYGGILLGSALVGGNLGNLFGTIIAVAYANLWARKTRRPTSIVLLPAIVLLVSGSIGFRGLAAMAAGQVSSGVQQFFQMFVVALTIAAGLLVGNTLVRPKSSL